MMKKFTFSLPNVNNIIITLLFASCISMVFYRSTAIMSIVTIILSFLILLNGMKSFNFSNKIYFSFFLVFIIILFKNLYYFGNDSLKNIGDALVLFVIPIFSKDYFNVEKKYFDKLLLFYTFCISLICVYIINFYISYIPHHKYNWYLARFFIEYNLEFHSTYIGIWISISILILIHLMITIKQKSIRVLAIFMLFLQFCTLIILNTRMALYALVIILIINAFVFFNKRQKIYVLLTSFLFFTLIISLTNRYKDDISFLKENSLKNSERYPIYKCALKLIDGHIILGNNLITLQIDQNKCYECMKKDELAKKNTNSHNQYLDYLLKGGVLLVSSFILLLIIKLKHSLKNRNYLYFSITLFFCFSFLTENVLSRQYGAFIYFFIDVLFLKTIFTDESHSSNKIEEA